MMIPFDKTENVLNSNPFISEEVRFNLLHLICDGNSSLLLRREDNRAIIAQSGPNFPVWVWTDDNLTQQEHNELAEDFYKLFSDRIKLSLVAKPSTAEFLARDYSIRRNISWKFKLFMEAYHCPKVLIPLSVSGEISKPSIDDIVIISDFFAGFIRDCFDINTTAEEQIETAKKYILSDNFYVWRVCNEIVCMANVAHRSPRHTRINEVYTPHQKRKKGYASALVAKLSKNIINEGRIPMLYTDLTNPDSNKVYKGVGYIECGKVNQISFIL